MAMEISKTFVVKANPEATWRFLTDPSRVARCLPGAAITGQVGDQTYGGTMTVKVGPVAASYKGTMKFERLDEAARTAEIVAFGQDVRGKGGADMHVKSRLIERAPGETEVAITSQVNVIGVLAQFGQRMIQDVSDQMFEKFVAAVRTELEARGEPQPHGSTQVAAASEAASLTTAGRDGAAPPSSGTVAHPVESEGTPPIEVLSFGSRIVARAAARTARRPAVWIAAGVLIVVIYWLWHR